MTIPKESARGTGTFTLTPTQDTIAEGDETIDVTGTADGFTVTKAEVTLTDDETAPASITLTTSPTSVLESASGTTVTVTATLDGSATRPSATDVVVSVGGGTATSGTDYAAVSDFTVTIPKESARGTATFTLTPTQDTIAEGDETIDVTGSATDFTVTKAEVTLTDDETAPASITLTTSPTSVLESASGTTVTVTATLDGSATRPSATDVVVSVGRQRHFRHRLRGGVDFTVTIPKESFTLTPTQDTIAEGVTGTADGFTVTKAEVTLTDDETAPASITLTTSPTSVLESASGTTVTVTATLGGSATRPSATDVVVSVGDGSATSGTDYAAVSDFTVTIPKESARGTGTFTLTPTNDAIAEGDETIDVTGTATGFIVTKAEVTLTDDETAPASITLTTSPTSVSESASGMTVTVTATLDGSATRPGATDVVVSVGGGSATSGTDYAAVSSFTVTIPKESASGTGTFTLTPTNDAIAEGDETIDVTGSATDFTVTKAEVTLTDDETAPASITLTTSPTSVLESASGTTVTVTATLGGSATRPSATDVVVSVGGGSATSGTDYAAVSDFTVTIPKESARGTGTFTLTPTNDAIAEGDETIDVTGTATGFTVTKAEVTLTDDETAPASITLTTSPTSVSESASGTTVTVTATLDGSATRPSATDVVVSVGDGSATSGTDYAAVSDFTVTIPKESARGTGTFTLTPTNDAIAEGDETIDVTGTATGFIVTKAEVTLTDDETAPASITLTTSPTSVSESASGMTVTVTATLDGSATRPGATDVVVSVGGGSATSGTDYAAVSDFTVMIPKESASGTGTFTLTPTNDAIAEGDETIDVTGTATGFTVTKAEVTLTDDDTAQRTVSFDKQSFTVREGATRHALMQVDLSGPLNREVTIPLTTTHGSGVEASDYDLAAIGAEDYYAEADPENATWTSLDEDLIFAPAETGKIVRVTAVDDSIVEDDEILELGFGTLPEGISPGSIRVARVTITDNDGDDGDDGDDDGDGDDSDDGEFRLTDEEPYADPDDDRYGKAGRVEVFHAGAWGTVCSDGIRHSTFNTFNHDANGALVMDTDGNPTETVNNNEAAALICRDSGYDDGEYHMKYGKFRPGQAEPDHQIADYWPADSSYPAGGPRPIWLDDLRCVAGGSALQTDPLPGAMSHCTYAGWGLHNCTHKEDAVVRCWNNDLGEENRRQPTNAPTATVAGPGAAAGTAGLTARFAQAPFEHDGASPFTVRIAFSEAVRIGNREFRDHAIEVTEGRATKVRKVNARRDRWEVTVEPESFADVSVSLPPTGDCAAPGALCTDDGRALPEGILALVRGPPALSVADARVREASGASLAFAVTLDRPASGPVTVDYATADGSATAGADYAARSGTLTFAPGETAKTVSVPVLDDAHDEGEETLALALSNASGARIEDGAATGTIENSDPLPQAWLARFGRTVAAQVADAIGERLTGGPGGGSQVTIGGRRVELDDPSHGAAHEGGGPDWAGAPPQAGDGWRWGVPVWDGASARARPQTAHEMLMRSSFLLALGGHGDGTRSAGPRWTAWGRAAVSRFDGDADGLSVDGEVTTVTLGADAAWARWLAGVAVAMSEGEGGFRDHPARARHEDRGSGRLESTLASVHPYVRFEVDERLLLWGILGAGAGEVTLAQDGTATSGRAWTTDTALQMVAAGARSVLVPAPEAGGLELAARADVLLMRITSKAVSDGEAGNLAAAEAGTSRLRLIVEGSRTFALGDGGTLTPSLELGLRADGGDAETGMGVELGAGLAWADPATGLTVQAKARGLVAHEAEEVREWGVSGEVRLAPGASGRGLSLTLAPAWGVASSGTERLWGLRDVRALAANDDVEPEGRVDAEVGYGLAAFGGRGLMTPYAGLALSEAGDRTWRTGARWTLGPDLAMHLEGTRREPANDNAPEHGVQFRFTLRW